MTVAGSSRDDAERKSRPSVDPWAPGGAMSSYVPPSSGPDREVGSNAEQRRPHDRKRIAARIAAIVAIVGVVVGGVLIARQNPEADAEPTVSSTIELSAQPRDPDPGAPAPDSIADDRDLPSAISEESSSVDVDVRPADALTEYVIDIDAISVPLPLHDIAPTEIVALSPVDGLVEISLPSGRVRTTALPFSTDRAQLVATDFGALVWPSTTTDIDSIRHSVIAIGQQPIPLIGESRVGHVTTSPGRDEFIVWPLDSKRTFAPVSVAANGDATSFGWGQFDSGHPRSMDPTGGLIDEGVGGVFRIDPNGSRRISTGDLIATGRNHVLLHECDDDRRCTLVTIDEQGQRIVGADTSTLHLDAVTALPGGVAPDGEDFLAIASADQRQLVAVSIADGRIEILHTSRTVGFDAAWATDASGVFYSDGGLRFRDRDGLTTDVPIAGLDLRAIAGRQPRTSTACEYASIAVARFDRMRLAGHAGAPSERVLAGLRSTGPPSLAADTEALADFVGGFVSAERADSERVENWPANVRAGIAAIEEFALTCP